MYWNNWVEYLLVDLLKTVCSKQNDPLKRE